MTSKNPYKLADSNSQAIKPDLTGIAMNESNPPPAYNGFQQPRASAPAPISAVNMQNNITSAAPTMTFPQPVGPQPMEMTCPSCRCRITTRLRHRSTAKTHIACLLLSWTLCCCCLPYCMDSCRNANHFCPMCGTFIGTYAS